MVSLQNGNMRAVPTSDATVDTKFGFLCVAVIELYEISQFRPKKLFKPLPPK